MKLIIFIRFQRAIDKNMLYSITYKNCRSNYFLKYLDYLVNESKNYNQYVNVYELKGNRLNKLCYIDKGLLFTL